LYGPHATAISAHLKYDQAVQVTLAQAVPADAAAGDVSVTCEVDQSVRACPAH
jgi:hypothetical protein